MKDPVQTNKRPHEPRRWLLWSFIAVCVIAAAATPFLWPNRQADAVRAITPFVLREQHSSSERFYLLPPDVTEEVLSALRRAGLKPDEEDTWSFVPVLMSYPGWFDFGLAPRWAEKGDVHTLERGKVRIFTGPDRTYVLVLTNRTAATASKLEDVKIADKPDSAIENEAQEYYHVRDPRRWPRR